MKSAPVPLSALDEVAVYDHPLSAATIASQYAAALGNESSSTQTTTYDQHGRILTQTDYDGNVASYSYTNTGASIAEVYQVTYTRGGSTTAAETVTYYYDHYGRKQQVIDSADGTTTYNYDQSSGTVTRNSITGVTTAVAGSFGNLTSVVTPQGTIHYVYDAVTGHLVETWTGTGADDTTSTTETLYGYDNQGRLASVTIARQGSSDMSGGSVTTRGDAVGDVLGTSQPTTLYLYDGDGNLIRQVNPNNTETDYDYTHYWDVGGGEEIVKNKRTSDGTTLSQFTYTFDANRNKISDLDQMTDAGEGASNTQLYTWAYDADGRLTDETFDNLSDGSGGTNIVSTDDYHDHYDYDLNGNRVDEKIDTSADGGTGSAAVYDQVTSSRYDARNELTSETQTTVATGTTVYSTHYLYDANGSILSSTRTGSDPAVTTYTYDARNRILTVSSGGSTTTYTYNDDGILVQQAVAGGDTTTYLIDTNNPTGYSQVLEVSKNGSLPTTTYTLGKTIIAQNSGGTISYIMPDGHGSTRQLTAFTTDASNGHVVARYDYDAFGNPITLTAKSHAANPASTSVLYVGMLLDPITGNYRTESREYTPADGRFFWRDSYMPAAGDIGNSNLYVYANSDPANIGDPTGRDGDLASELAVTGMRAALFAWNTYGVVSNIEGAVSNSREGIKDFEQGHLFAGVMRFAAAAFDGAMATLGLVGMGSFMKGPPSISVAFGYSVEGGALRASVNLLAEANPAAIKWIATELLPGVLILFQQVQLNLFGEPPGRTPSGKTTGVLDDGSGEFPEFPSGEDGPAKSFWGQPGFDAVSRTHAEGHAAAYMRMEKIAYAVLRINNGDVCDNCKRNLPKMLGPGHTLTVIDAQGRPETFTGE